MLEYIGCHLAIVYVQKRKERGAYAKAMVVLILYQAYGNLYTMTGRKAHLHEDKQIPSVGVFDEFLFDVLAFEKHLEEKHVTWARFRKKLDKNATFQAGDFHPDAFTKSA
ncbi:hypothetical protein Tco_1261372 [Tanacetum coccineum]